jgi:polyhydroxyalkanoate synthesis regulator phasin
MEETIRKVIKTGYGLGLLTLAQAKKVAARVKKELKLNEKESLNLAKELVANSDRASKEVLKAAAGHFERALVKSGVVKKREVRVVKKRVRTAKKAVKKAVKRRLGK